MQIRMGSTVHPFILKITIMSIQIKKVGIALILLILASVSPNLFMVAQAGLAPFHDLILKYLFPSAVLIVLVITFLAALKWFDIARLAINGIVAGLLSTVVLEILREAGFRIGFMPGDIPRLMGVLMLNQFASGPDTWSDLSGWSYHFWNGASFGLIFSLLLGKSKIWQGILYGLLIAVVFMISPVVKSLGIGKFGVDFKDGYQFASVVILAHASFGLALSFLLRKFNKALNPFWKRSFNKTIPKKNTLMKRLLSQIWIEEN